MNCNVIQDLLPLYADDCCSAESARLVEEHIAGCESCKAALDTMRQPVETCAEGVPATKPMGRIHLWKASVLQSVLFLISFAIITVGVALEARIPTGMVNGFAAIDIVVPATGFLLSLTNWYFVRLYKSRKSFSFWTLMITIIATIAALAFTMFHYEMFASLDDMVLGLHVFASFGGGMFALVLCVASKLLSNWYAKLIGKE